MYGRHAIRILMVSQVLIVQLMSWKENPVRGRMDINAETAVENRTVHHSCSSFSRKMWKSDVNENGRVLT
jgi:hypothetical protein